MSAFADAITASMTTVNAAAGETITYTRGLSSVEVTATRGQRQLALVDEAGAETVFHATDFLCLASAIDFGAGQVEPAPGDSIEADGITYQVADEAGAKHFDYRDAARTLLRIHTKQVAS